MSRDLALEEVLGPHPGRRGEAGPERLRTVTPRLMAANGRAAIAFYAQVFGAEEVG